MAVLRNGDLSLEIQYSSFDRGGVIYDILLRWRGEPVLNDAILKRSNKYWENRGTGAIRADAERECGFLPLIRRGLETNKAGFWEPSDPDIRVAVYPGSGFPFLTPDRDVSREERAESESSEREHLPSDPVPSDYWELILFVDAYNFEGAKGYYGTGVCFRLASTREEMERFHEVLKQEYRLFRSYWKVQEVNEAEWGPDYRPPEF